MIPAVTPLDPEHDQAHDDDQPHNRGDHHTRRKKYTIRMITKITTSVPSPMYITVLSS